jgi:hypothetical protein
MRDKLRFFLLFGAAFIVFACATQPETEPDGAVALWRYTGDNIWRTASYNRAEELALFPERGDDSPELTFAVALLDAEDSLHTLLSKTLYDGLSCEKYTDERWNDVKNKYLNSKPEDGTVGESYNWYYTEGGEGYIYENIVVIKRLRDFYEGGAHGIQEKECFVLDTGSSKQVRFNDIIKQESRAALQKQIEAALYTKYAKNTRAPRRSPAVLTDIGFSQDSADIPENNFYINDDGLGFVWADYAIAPHSFGIIEIVLPFETLKDYTTPYGATVFQTVIDN